MKVAVLVENKYQVLEVWYPYLRLREEGIKTVLVGTGQHLYQSKEGYPAQEELPVKKADPKKFAGVIIPGGFAPDYLRRYVEINRFVKNLFQSDKLVAAICHGGWVLVSAGILQNRKATSFMAIKDDMVNAGVQYMDQEVVVDQNLITSRNPYDLPAFCREIITFLKTKK
jgi:protease I